MKRSILFRTLLCLLVCGCLLLCACSEEQDVSSASSQPTATKVQQMSDALDKGQEFLSQTETLFGTPIFSMWATAMGNGLCKEQVTLDTLSVMGTSYIGTQPLILLQEKTLVDGASHTVGTLSAAGDTIHFVYDDTPEGQYLAFPQAGESGFVLTEVLETFPTALLGAGSLQLQDALTEEQITVAARDGKTEYTAVFGEAFVSELQDTLVNVRFPATDSLLTCTVTVLSDEQSYLQKTVVQQEDRILLQTSYTLEKKGGSLSFGAEILREDTPLFAITGTVSATRRSMTVEAEMVQTDKRTLLSLTLVSESAQKATMEGEMTVIRSEEDVRIPQIPLELTGWLSAEGEEILLSLAVGASVEGKLNLSMEVTKRFAPDDGELPPPMDGTKLPAGDMDAIADGLRQYYPDAAALYDGLFHGDESSEGVSSLTYRDEAGSLVLTLYGDGTVGLSLTGDCLTEEDSLSLSYKGNPLFSVPCIANENGTYTIWNTLFAYRDETYSYLSPGGTRWIELMHLPDSEGVALFDLCLPVTVTESTLEILMPDGSTLSIPYQAGKDGLSVGLWDVELKFVPGNLT